MEYDFAGVSDDLLEKLSKRLSSFNKAVLKDFNFALNVINDTKTSENRPQINVQITDLLNDQLNKSVIFYTETFNKIQNLLKNNLR